MTVSSPLHTNTLVQKAPLWAANIRENFNEILARKDISSLPRIHGPALCVGAGPSLDLHLDQIRDFKGEVFACERGLVPLLKHGRIPNYVVSIDGDPIMVKFMEDPIVGANWRFMTGIFAVDSAPAVVNRWKGHRVFFSPWMGDEKVPGNLTTFVHHLTGKPILQTGGNCGSCLWFLAKELGASPIVLLGIDFAYANIDYLDKTQIWERVKELPQDKILEFYCRVKNSFGNEVITDLMFDDFKNIMLTWLDGGPETIQCSDYTILESPHLKMMKFKDYLTSQV